MIPGKYNMVCPQGSTFVQELTYSVNDVPVDLTGYSVSMQVREKHASKTAVASATSVGGLGGIEILGGGMIRITMDAAFTATLVAKDYVYDIELTTPAGVVNRILEGKFIVTPEVTR